MRCNAGYEIIKSIKLPDIEFVLGERQSSLGTQYVTWRCYDEKDYYFGHYTTSYNAALCDLYERAQDEIIYIISTLKENNDE